MLPQADSVIAEHVNRFVVNPRGRFKYRNTGLDRVSHLVSNVDWNDIANLADVAEAPPWDCEITKMRWADMDDGF